MTHRQYFKAVDPAVLCPIAGFVDPNNPVTLNAACVLAGYEKIITDYVPDPAIPTIETTGLNESVILICSTQLGGVVSFYINTSSGQYKYEIFGAGNALLTSGNINSGTAFGYTFNTAMAGYESVDGHKYFKVVFTAVTAGQHITIARINSTTAIYPIIEAYLNIPYATAFNFHNSQILKKIWCCGTMDYLTNTTYNILRNTYLLQDVTMPVSMDAITSTPYWFAYTGCQRIVMPESMAAVTSWQYLFYYAETKEITFPTYCPLLSDIQRVFGFMPIIKEIILPDSIPGGLGATSSFQGCVELEKIVFGANMSFAGISSTFVDCKKLKQPHTNGSLVIPISANNTSIGAAATNCISIKKLKFPGTANSLSSFSANATGCTLLEELELPSELNAFTTFNGNYIGTPTGLKKLVLPLSMTGLSGGISLIGATLVNVEEITTCNDWGANIFTSFGIGARLPKLLQFNQPSLKAASITMNGTSTVQNAMNYIEVSWSSTTEYLDLQYNSLSASELNRIMTALPTVSARNLMIRGNTGSATCDISIATAKGWLVTN